MAPLVPILAGLVALVAGWLLMRRLGPGARIGRIIAATPVVPVARAIELAAQGTPRYVAVGGRIGSDGEFEDESGRPLVFRRTRLELRRGSGWAAIEDRREVVPFEIAGDLLTMAVDADALGAGLVVVTRESEGTASEISDRVPPGTDPATPVRLRVEHVSSIDHALVLGVPSMDPARGPILRPGLGRPLVLTTLEPAEAMRLLAGGRRGSAVAISVLLAVGLVAVAVGLLWALLGSVAVALAGSPSPTGAAGGDPRSSGQGPGLVGDPLAAIVLVAAIAIASLVATLVYVRLTGGPRGSQAGR